MMTGEGEETSLWYWPRVILVYESVSWIDNTGVLCENVWLYESSRYDVKLPMWA